MKQSKQISLWLCKEVQQALCSFLGQNSILGQCCLDKKRIVANNSRCSLRWGSYPFCRVLTLETLSRDVPLYRLSSFFNPIWPGLFWCLRDPEGGTLCPPKYLWVGWGKGSNVFFKLLA